MRYFNTILLLINSPVAILMIHNVSFQHNFVTHKLSSLKPLPLSSSRFQHNSVTHKPALSRYTVTSEFQHNSVTHKPLIYQINPQTVYHQTLDKSIFFTVLSQPFNKNHFITIKISKTYTQHRHSTIHHTNQLGYLQKNVPP